LNALEDFQEWCKKANPSLKEVEELMACKISDQPEILIEQLTEIEAYNGRVGYLLAQAEGHLDHYQFLLLPSKEGITDFERKVRLEYEVSEIRKWRNRIENISDSIKTRITMGQSILKYQVIFMERNQTPRPQ
jgi:hypothetical protein